MVIFFQCLPMPVYMLLKFKVDIIVEGYEPEAALIFVKRDAHNFPLTKKRLLYLLLCHKHLLIMIYINILILIMVYISIILINPILAKVCNLYF